MDSIDIKILRALNENARAKASAISKQVNLSVSAVIERMHKLEDSGVITGYTALLDHKALGRDISAWLEVNLEHPKHFDHFTEKVQRLHNVLACYYLTGDFDFMLHVMASSSEELEAVHQKIKQMEGVCVTKTHIVLKEIKRNACLLPEIE